MAKVRCRYCRCLLTLTKRNPDQKYCSKPECRMGRKRLWQKRKMQEDEAYKLKRDANHR